MSYVRVVAISAAGLVLGSCQTIIEDMPASAVLPSSAPVPIVVIQLPQIQPTVAAPEPSSGGGGGGGGGTTPTSPAAQPTNPPSNNGGGGNCSGWPSNCNPVASIHAHVYFLICGGNVVDARYATDGPADCDVRLDATPKDAQGKHTQAKGTPEWRIDGASWYVGNNPYTPTVRGQRGGFTAVVTIDGVNSNVINYSFR